MQNFRTYQMALELYKAVKGLSLKGELRDQIERASLSVVLNLAEGSGRKGKDRLHHFRIAMGSLKEVQGCLAVIESPLYQQADCVAGSLYRLLKNPGPGL
jgi:four helix bundle protein